VEELTGIERHCEFEIRGGDIDPFHRDNVGPKMSKHECRMPKQ